MKIRLGGRRWPIGHPLKLMLLGLLASFLVIACRGQTDSAGKLNQPTATSSVSNPCQTIKHDLGETQVCGQPQRIVVLGPYILELLLALDVQPAGFADHEMLHKGDYNNPSQQIPYLGSRVTSQPANVGLAYEPSIEAILKLQPNLILGSDWLNQEYETLSKIAPTLLFKLFDVNTNLRAIAQAVRRPEKAEELIAQRQQQVADARKDFTPVVNAYPDVLILAASDIHDLTLITKNNISCGSLIEDLGFQLVYPPGMNKKDYRPQISLEVLPQLNKANSVVLLDHNPNQLKGMNNFDGHQLTALEQAWKKNAIAQSLKASKAKRVYSISAYPCFALHGPIGTELTLNELRKQMLPNQ